MKIYAVNIDGNRRLCTVHRISYKNGTVELVDVENNRHIVTTTEGFKQNTTSIFDFDEIPTALRKAVLTEDRKRYDEAVKNYNALCGYLNGKDESRKREN